MEEFIVEKAIQDIIQTISLGVMGVVA